MSYIRVNDVFEELSEENKRLLNELMFAKKCLKILFDFKGFIDFMSDKLKKNLDSIECQSFEKFCDAIEEVKKQRNYNNISTDVNPIVISSQKQFSNITVLDTNIDSDYIIIDEKFQNSSDYGEEVPEEETQLGEEEQMFCEQTSNNSNSQDFQPTSHELKRYQNQSQNITVLETTLASNSVTNDNNSDNFYKEDSGEETEVDQLYCEDSSNDYNSDELQRKIYERQRYVCHFDNCGLEFNELHLLSSHEVIHIEDGNSLICKVDGNDSNCIKSVNHETNKEQSQSVCETTTEQTILCPKPDCNHKMLKTLLELHLSFFHKKYVIHCPIKGCDHSFNILSEYKKHLKTHSSYSSHLQKLKRFMCEWEACGQQFNNYDSYNKHRAAHVRANGLDKCGVEGCVYRVNTCKSSYYYLKTYLTQHFNGVHNRVQNGSNSVECGVEGCDKSFKNMVRLNDHMRKTHITRRVRCSYKGCGKWYKNKLHLSSHIQSNHLGKTFSCDWPQCEYIAKTGPNLTKHMRVHKPESRPKYSCDWPECGRIFLSKKGLDEHVRMHKNERPYVCNRSGCKYSTGRVSDLDFHKRNSHGKKSRKHCTHDGCDKWFRSNTHLKSHLRNCHLKKRYHCEWLGCKYMTTNKTNLSRHEKTHNPESLSKFDWPDCNQTFVRRLSLDEHVKIHKTEMAYSCKWPRCLYTTDKKQNLILHKRLNHNQNT